MILVAGAPVVAPEDEAPLEPVVETGSATASLAWSWSAPWLGRTWNLTDLASPVLKLRGATGTGQVDPTHWWSEAPTVDGSQWEGARVGSGSVFMPLQVTGADTDDFLANHDAFMASLDPSREGVLRITLPDGRWREIGCRYESGADESVELDPVKRCRAVYGITWVSADPYWRGEEITRRFENDSGAGFFPGPPFHIGKGLTLQDPTIVNPGDIEAYPVWRIEGPFTGFSVGVGASLVEMTLTRGVDQWVEIDMTPRRLTIMDESAADRWDDVTEVAFSAVPPGATQLATTVTGAGPASAIELRFSPRFRRAW